MTKHVCNQLNKFSLVFVSWFYILGYVSAQDQCRSYNGNEGTCILLERCKPFFDMNRKLVKTKEDLKVLQQASCGMNSQFKPKVCCPPESEWLTLTNVSPVTYPVNRIKPNASKHKEDTDKNTELTMIYEEDENCPYTLKAPTYASKCCGIEASSSDRIKGGEDAGVDQYPWLALLEYAGGFTYCGGSLISSRYVLSAAHCVGDTRYGEPLKVRLAEYNTSSFPEDVVEVDGGGFETIYVLVISIEKRIPHPHYKGHFQGGPNDIGLVKLSKNAPYTEFIRPICLPNTDITETVREGTRFIVAGWGSDGNEFSDIKQHLNIPFVPRDKCQRSYKQTLVSTQICAGGELNRDSCKGDSGGPLMYSMGNVFILVGVVSFGHKNCGTINTPGVYTNVYNYLNWIHNEMV